MNDTLEAQGIAAFERGELALAESLLRRAMAQSATVSVVYRLAVVLYRLQQFGECARLFAAVAPHLPLEPAAVEAFSFALEQCGDFERSLALREQLLAAVPGEDSAVKYVDTLVRHGRTDLLDARLPALLAQYPGQPRLLGQAASHALASGEPARGLALLSRLVPPGGSDPALAALPHWDGQAFDGTLLLPMEPHIGEEILVSYFLGDLERIGQHAAVEVDARLVPLLARRFASVTFVPRGQLPLAAAGAGKACRRAEPVDIAQAFHAARLAAGSPAWLRADAQRAAALRADYRARWPGKQVVGISWRSLRLLNDLDPKSVPLAALRRTLALPDTVFVSVQYGDARRDIEALVGSGLPVPFLDEGIDATRDIDGLAAQLCALDHLVCVSNTTAHLAGALGVATTVLLPRRFPVLWHWGYRGERTPWYASVRLLRNSEDAGFAALDAALAEQLRQP